MKKTIFKLNQGYYFQLPVRIFAFSLPFFAIFLNSYLLAMLAIAMAVLLITTRYFFELDIANRTIHQYLWIMGFKQGEKIQFKSLEKVTIGKRTKSQTFNSRGSSSTITFDNYFMMLYVDGSKIEIFDSEKREKVDKVQNRFSTYAGNISFEDNV